MKFKTVTKSLLDALKQLKKTCPAKHEIPMLKNVLISVSEHKVTLSTTDLEIYQNITLDDTEIQVTGQSVVDLHSLIKMLTAIKDKSGYVEIELKKDVVSFFVTGKKEVTLNLESVNPDMFPMNADINNEKFITFNRNDLHTLLHKSLPFISQNENRPYFEGMHLKYKNDSAIATATNCHMLSVCHRNAQVKGEIDIIIPFNTVKLLSDLLAPVKSKADQELFESELVTIWVNCEKCKITYNDMVITSTLIEGVFPDMERIIHNYLSSMLQVFKGDTIRIEMSTPNSSVFLYDDDQDSIFMLMPVRLS